jgi:hypothetical protein
MFEIFFYYFSVIRQVKALRVSSLRNEGKDALTAKLAELQKNSKKIFQTSIFMKICFCFIIFLL